MDFEVHYSFKSEMTQFTLLFPTTTIIEERVGK